MFTPASLADEFEHGLHKVTCKSSDVLFSLHEYLQVFVKQLPNPIQTSPGSITLRDVNTRLFPTAQVTNEQLPSWLTSLYLLFTPPPPKLPI